MEKNVKSFIVTTEIRARQEEPKKTSESRKASFLGNEGSQGQG